MYKNNLKEWNLFSGKFKLDADQVFIDLNGSLYKYNQVK